HLRALEAVMDGFEVLPINEAAPLGDIFVTITGDISVIRASHIKKMKDGAILCNSGHFNVEIDLAGLERLTVKRRTIRPFLEECTLKNARHIYILGEGRLINLAAAEGHPPSVMDMSFANQALAAEYIHHHGADLEARVYPVPVEIDQSIAALKLKALGIKIDTLTKEQQRYLTSWEMGT
ncbi:MAG: adenosylhomocysteinase, partial [Candidatus Tectimicrobiota bacterium]